MRYIGLAVLVLAWAGVCAQAQVHQSTSVGGFGSVLYPGTGHPPPRPLAGVNGSLPRGRAGFGVQGFSSAPPRLAHPSHGRGTIVAVPVIVGGGYYGYGYGYDQGQPPYQGSPDQPPIVNSNSAPSVVVNQNFIPDRANPMVRDYGDNTAEAQQGSAGMRMYQAPPSHPYADQADQGAPMRRTATNDDQPTIYLIALRDHNIVQALGYWMEGATLHYVNAEHSLNQVSLDLVDRDLSSRLNDERGVEFKLPKQ
jgi:hypothetical protein